MSSEITKLGRQNLIEDWSKHYSCDICKHRRDLDRSWIGYNKYCALEYQDQSSFEDIKKALFPQEKTCTCTPNERKFLDIIKERSSYFDSWKKELVIVDDDGEYSALKQESFNGVDLREFIKKVG